MDDFADQTAVVTGASRGIGRAISLELARRGAAVYAVGRDFEELEQKAELSGRDRVIRTYRADLSSDEEVEGLAAALERDAPAVDLLIHSAGVISLGRVETLPVAEFDRQYRVNLRAPYRLTQLLLDRLKVCKGQIVFINSSAGLKADVNGAQYAATKHGLKAVADALRNEVNEFGIRVLSVYPGRTATDMQMNVHDYESRPYRKERLLQPEDIATTVIGALSLPRSAEVTDVAVRPLVKPS
jgi:NAD(P)-dependent dehydrogenase (short-subunit alcohol dehydrogenase family)